jgi:hypothetical protein
MAVRDITMDKNSKTPLKCITLQLGTTATGQTGKKTDGTVPGFAFQVVKVEVNALTVTATISMDVQIETTSVLTGAVTPVAATPTAGTLSSTLASIRGSATDAINLLYTSNGSGAATNGVARVWIRPLPMNGEVYAV